MAKHTPFPHVRTLPEGEANRSTSWVAASPLSAPHLSADPCPASGARTRTMALFPFCIQQSTASVWGRVKGIKQRGWGGNGRHVRDVLSTNVMMRCWGILKVDQGVTQNLDLKCCRLKKKKKKEAFAWRNTGHCLLLECFYFVFSNHRKVKCDFLIGLIKTAPSETLDAAVIHAFHADFCPWDEIRRANSYWLQVSFHSNSQGRH